MQTTVLRFLLILPLAFSAAPAVGEGPVGEPGEWVTVPGNPFLDYQWRDDGAGPEVVAIRYAGKPEWLVEQEHPRSHWHELPSLEMISFDRTSVTREQMEYVAQLEAVEYLEFVECVYEGNTFAPLERMRWLRSLEIDFFMHSQLAEPDAEFFEFLEGLVRLENLNLHRVGGVPIDEQTFRTITELEKLEGLSLRLQEMDAETLGRIGKLSQLDFLYVLGLDDPSPLLQGLRDHPRLTTLTFNARTLDDDDVASLASLKSLKYLSISGTSIASLAPFDRLTNLRELTLSVGKYEAGPDGFGWLGKAPQLEALRVWGSAGEQVPLEVLRGHEGIRELVVPNISLGEDAIDVLESMPSLEELRVDVQPTSSWYHAVKRRLPDLEITARE